MSPKHIPKLLATFSDKGRLELPENRRTLGDRGDDEELGGEFGAMPCVYPFIKRFSINPWFLF